MARMIWTTAAAPIHGLYAPSMSGHAQGKIVNQTSANTFVLLRLLNDHQAVDSKIERVRAKRQGKLMY